ncbi:MAG: aldo/keto reductase [Gammaproteobacteria bacterium CG11_big_fil_rev_8_21_14_0_20_46_22]|nr:MAG: aldo/keto reductase [Gammaproteobacteria bacterium CG12_big_fil_rev_8_21_14_0_65_46_12]PIR10314.1 MAG: aldo/keto reductase [Gammaproteobacteria bacterium CG11_big_fil_rev_8_21_14_0_20_46_22]
MKYQAVSGIDRALSYIGLGTVKLGRDQGVKYPASFKIPSDKEAADLIALTKDLGVNVIDTAPAYGQSEARLGQLLKGQRDDWVIISKAGENFENGESTFDFSAGAIEDSVKRSLKRLSTDVIDMLLIHSNGDDARLIEEDDVFGTLSKLKQNGLIKTFGMSVKTVKGGELTLKYADAAMITLNPFDRECESLLPLAERLGKAVLIKKAFASGHAYAGDQRLTPAEIFQFLSAFSAITSVIVGTINPAHLRSNVRACF